MHARQKKDLYGGLVKVPPRLLVCGPAAGLSPAGPRVLRLFARELARAKGRAARRKRPDEAAVFRGDDVPTRKNSRAAGPFLGPAELYVASGGNIRKGRRRLGRVKVRFYAPEDSWLACLLTTSASRAASARCRHPAAATS